MSIWKQIRLILQIILCSTGSQCNSFIVSLMWSNLRKQAITRAAAFWTLYSLLISYLGRPCKSELQKSSFEFMNPCTRISAVVTLIYLRTLAIFLRAVECHFNYVVNMKRHRYGVIEHLFVNICSWIVRVARRCKFLLVLKSKSVD